MFFDFVAVLAEMLSYTFIVRAFIVGTLVSICAALLGVSLVLKRYSMIGDGLSHVGFGSLALATALNVAPLAVSIPVIIAAAFLLLRLSENSKIKGDAAIALICTSSLAIGVVIISQTTGMNTDVCNYLFGSILAMSKTDVQLSIVLSITVLTLFIVFYNKLFAITFDETFAKATGVKTGVYNMLIAFLTAITIVLGMRMMGAMLISSLIVFPALTSMRLFKKFKSVTLCSALLSVVCFFTGVIISYIYATPTGASVVMINIFAFILFWGISVFARQGKAVKTASLASMAALFFFFGCGNAKSILQKSNTAGTLSVALPKDLAAGEPVLERAEADEKAVIEIKEKMFIAQINDVYLNPEDYLGRTINLEGLFKAEQYGNQTYCFVIRYGPGCCGNDGNAGFEVAWDDQDGAAYPDIDEWVEANGVLRTYEEDGYPYLYLALSSLSVSENRGAEFVTQ
ncbi:MAG: metal ABC transporter permease [Spirochaetaceae bacterium]|jgi:zinc transport system permease protein|nr:metal ABC transporter permease [Spirochaetaceae bacterium]